MPNPLDTMRVSLSPHDPRWLDLARRESRRLAEVAGDNLITVHHIGSTAIPGISTKPVIDLLPVVHSLEALDERADGFRQLGYNWRGEFGLPGRRFCTLNDPATDRRLFNVHIWSADSDQILRHVAFRDYLLAHPEEAREYEAEKMRAAALHPDDVLAYNDAKDPWIKACEIRAQTWFQSQQPTA
ncbi:MAG TPA: GrpB family protein [Bryobacteraceae bacterium]|nr:GrpB family protein [Bryobacteraceae bacterium]